MTDLLTRDPNDTGEIPTAVDPGPDTRNLAPYAVLPPALRRPTAEVPVIDLGDCQATIDGELRPPSDPPIPHPDPLPPPPPPRPRVDDRPLSAGDEIVWAQTWRPETKRRSWLGRLTYRGDHRRARGAK